MSGESHVPKMNRMIGKLLQSGRGLYEGTQLSGTVARSCVRYKEDRVCRPTAEDFTSKLNVWGFMRSASYAADVADSLEPAAFDR